MTVVRFVRYNRQGDPAIVVNYEYRPSWWVRFNYWLDGYQAYWQ